MRSFGLLLSLAIPAIAATGPAPETPDFFETPDPPLSWPVIAIRVHTDSRLGGLRVDSRDALLKGGKTGPAIVAGDPDKSLLILAVRFRPTRSFPCPWAALSSKTPRSPIWRAWVQSRHTTWPDGPAPVAVPTKPGQYVIYGRTARLLVLPAAPQTAGAGRPEYQMGHDRY